MSQPGPEAELEGWRRLVLLLVALALALAASRAERALFAGGGDAVQYLVQARSLARDGDVRLSDAEVSLEGTLEFSPFPVEVYRVGGDRQVAAYPLGAPLLFAPAYRLGGGRPGVLALLWFMAVLAAASLRRLCDRFGGDPVASLVAMPLVMLAVPVLPACLAAMTELPALLVWMWALELLTVPRPAAGRVRGRAAAAGALLAFMPWLHLRYLPPAGLLAAWAIWRWRQEGTGGRRALPVFLGSLGLGLGLIPVRAMVALGDPDPLAWLRLSSGAHAGLMSWQRLVVRGLPGILVDQAGGLLVHAPHLMLGLVGLAQLAPRRRRGLGPVASGGLVTAVIVGSFSIWWGGWAGPGRFFVILAPLFGAGLAGVVARLRRRLPGSLAPGLLPLGAGLWVTGRLLENPGLALSLERAGVNRDAMLVDLYLSRGWDLLASFPCYRGAPTARDHLLAASLLLGAAGFGWWLHRACTRRRGGPAAWLALAWVLVHFGVAPFPPGPTDPLAEDQRWRRADRRFLLDYPHHYMVRAAELAAGGRVEPAARCLERALAADPGLLDAYVQLASLRAPGDPAGARRVARAGLVQARRGRPDPERDYRRVLLALMAGDQAGVAGPRRAYIRAVWGRLRELAPAPAPLGP